MNITLPLLNSTIMNPSQPKKIVSVNPYEWPFHYSSDGKPLHAVDLSDEIWRLYKEAVEHGHRVDGAPLEVFDPFERKWRSYGPKSVYEDFHWGSTEYRLGTGSPAVFTRGTRYSQLQPDGTVRYIQQPSNRIL